MRNGAPEQARAHGVGLGIEPKILLLLDVGLAIVKAISEKIVENIGIIYLGMTLLGITIHFWTIIISFTAFGLFAAILALIFPVVSEIFWGIVFGNAAGTILNPYCLALFSYIGLWIIILKSMNLRESQTQSEPALTDETRRQQKQIRLEDPPWAI